MYGLRSREQSCKKGLVFNVLGMKLPEIEVQNGAMCLCQSRMEIIEMVGSDYANTVA